MPVPCSVTPAFRHAASSACTPDALWSGIDPADRRHDVLARLEERITSRVLASTGAYTTASASIAQISSSVPIAVHADRVEPADLADVAPDLLRAVHPRADELELGVREHAADRLLPDEPGRPLDHSIGHVEDSRPWQRDWREWHAAYDRCPTSPADAATPRASCRGCIRDALDRHATRSDPRDQRVRGRRPRPARRARRPPACRRRDRAPRRARPRARGDGGRATRRRASTSSAATRRRPARTRARSRPTSCSCAACSATSPTTTSHNTVAHAADALRARCDRDLDPSPPPARPHRRHPPLVRRGRVRGGRVRRLRRRPLRRRRPPPRAADSSSRPT